MSRVDPLPVPSFLSDGFVTSTAAEVATRSGRPLPGRDLHPLEHSHLSRRTWAATVAQAFHSKRENL